MKKRIFTDDVDRDNLIKILADFKKNKLYGHLSCGSAKYFTAILPGKR